MNGSPFILTVLPSDGKLVGVSPLNTEDASVFCSMETIPGPAEPGEASGADFVVPKINRGGSRRNKPAPGQQDDWCSLKHVAANTEPNNTNLNRIVH